MPDVAKEPHPIEFNNGMQATACGRG